MCCTTLLLHHDIGLVLMHRNWNKCLADLILKSLGPFPCTQWLFLFLSASCGRGLLPGFQHLSNACFSGSWKVIHSSFKDSLIWSPWHSFLGKNDFFCKQGWRLFYCGVNTTTGMFKLPYLLLSLKIFFFGPNIYIVVRICSCGCHYLVWKSVCHILLHAGFSIV